MVFSGEHEEGKEMKKGRNREKSIAPDLNSVLLLIN